MNQKILTYLTLAYFVMLTAGCTYHYHNTNPNVDEAFPPLLEGSWTIRV